MNNLSSEKKILAKKYFEDFYHQTNAENSVRLIEQLVANDFFDHAPLPGLSSDKEGFKIGVSTIVNAFFQEYEVTHLFSEENVHTGVWKAKVTHQGNFMGIKETHKTFEIEGITIYEIKDGKITQHWEKFDLIKIMNELVPKLP